MNKQKNIALVAHDKKKNSLLKWAKQHQQHLNAHKLYATGSTGKLLEEKLGMTVCKLASGPLGGDQQLGAMISEQKIDILIFFWDPLEAHPSGIYFGATARVDENGNLIQAKLGSVVLASAPQLIYEDDLIHFGTGTAISTTPQAADGEPLKMPS